MKNNNKKQITNNKQAGLALADLIMYLVGVAALTVVALAMFGDTKGKISHSGVKEEVSVFFPVAVQSCLNRTRNDLSGCTAAKITTVSISPLSSTTTACGDTWSVVASAASVVLTYPLDGCIDNDSFGGELETELTALHKISAAYSESTDDLSVTYSR